MTLFEFIESKERGGYVLSKHIGFNLSKNEHRELFNEVFEMFDCFPSSIIIINKKQYIVTLEHENLACCDINQVDEWFQFTNIFNIPERKLRRTL